MCHTKPRASQPDSARLVYFYSMGFYRRQSPARWLVGTNFVVANKQIYICCLLWLCRISVLTNFQFDLHPPFCDTFPSLVTWLFFYSQYSKVSTWITSMLYDVVHIFAHKLLVHSLSHGWGPPVLKFCARILSIYFTMCVKNVCWVVGILL